MLGLFLSAIINVMGEIIYKQIPIKDYDEDNLDIHLDIKGRGEYKFLDENNEYDYSTGFLINDLEDVNDFSMYELS